MKAVMYGAGNIGRGFIGAVFHKAGYEVVFIDINAALVESLNRERRYPVRIVGDNERDEWIDNVRAIDLNNIEQIVQEISTADIMATSIGAANLPNVAPVIARALELRWSSAEKRPLDLLICENLMNANHVFYKLLREAISPDFQALMDEKLGLVETSIGRMVPVITPEMRGDNPLRVCVEEYDFLPVDAAAFKGPLPPYPRLVPYSPFGFYLERKLYLHNMGNAISAYLGDLKGYEFIWQAMEDLGIFLFVQNAMVETACMLAKKYGVDYGDIEANIDDLLLRFTSKALNDTVARVGRDPLRKLAPEDRLVGAARECVKFGIAPTFICLGLASALRFYVRDSQADAREAAEQALADVCKIAADDPLHKLSMTFFDALMDNACDKDLLLLAEKLKKEQRGDKA